MNAKVIKIKCITNMHVGNGEVNYNIIDNEVERDAVTNYPVINASGVKGALREYCVKEGVADGIGEAEVVRMFGSDAGGKNTPGELKILAAEMIALPARASAGDAAYYMVSTKDAWNRFLECCDLFAPKATPHQKPKPENAKNEVESIPVKEFVELGDTKIYLLEKAEFDKISLPVIARNKLENGISQNLWYEEVVPHESIFYFSVMCSDEALLNKFADFICKPGHLVQFGGNASIGYGLCKAEVLKEAQKHE